MVIMLVNRLSEKSEINGLKRLSENELVEELWTWGGDDDLKIRIKKDSYYIAFCMLSVICFFA